MIKHFLAGYDLQMDPEVARLARIADDILTGHLNDIAANNVDNGTRLYQCTHKFNMPIGLDNLMSAGQAQCIGHALKASKIKTPEKALKAALSYKNVEKYLKEPVPQSYNLELIGTKRTFRVNSNNIVYGRATSIQFSSRKRWMRDITWQGCTPAPEAFAHEVIALVTKTINALDDTAVITFTSVEGENLIWCPKIFLEFTLNSVPLFIEYHGHEGHDPAALTNIIIAALPEKDAFDRYARLLKMLERTVDATLKGQNLDAPPNMRYGLLIERQMLHVAIWSDKINNKLQSENHVIAQKSAHDHNAFSGKPDLITIESMAKYFQDEIRAVVNNAVTFTRRHKVLHRKDDAGMFERCMVTDHLVTLIERHDPDMAAGILKGDIKTVKLPPKVLESFLPAEGIRKHQVNFGFLDGRIVSSFSIKPGISWKHNALWMPAVPESAMVGLVGRAPEAIIEHPISELIGPVSSARIWGGHSMVIRFQKKILEHATKEQDEAFLQFAA